MATTVDVGSNPDPYRVTISFGAMGPGNDDAALTRTGGEESPEGGRLEERTNSRMRLLPESATYTSPAASMDRPNGVLSAASAAGPPSPANPGSLVPARMNTEPPAESSNTRFAPDSATNRF